MRILRSIMLLTGIAVFMPSPPEDKAQGGTAPVVAENSDAGLLGSATLAFADVAAFCARQPEVCRTAGYVAGKLEAKAKYGVVLLYRWASESTLPPLDTQAVASDPMPTGSTLTVIAKTMPAAARYQTTLRLEDLLPPWRGPSAHKKS